MKKYLNLLKNLPNSRLECTNHTLFRMKMVEIDTYFRPKRLKNHSLYRGLPPPEAKNALQIMSLAAYASETKKL